MHICVSCMLEFACLCEYSDMYVSKVYMLKVKQSISPMFMFYS